MSDYFIYAQGAIGAPGPASQTDTVPKWPLGYTALGIDRANTTGSGAVPSVGEFVYCRGFSASTVASRGQWVRIQNGSAFLMAAAESASALPVGIAAGVLSTTSVYGWVQIAGRVDYARGTNSSIAAGIPLYICAGTAGLALSNAVAGNRIQGAVCPVSYTSSQSASLTVELNRPFINGATAVL